LNQCQCCQFLCNEHNDGRFSVTPVSQLKPR